MAQDLLIPSRPRLVDDLIPLILESSNNWWRRDLLRLARVSLAWLGNIRKRLYVIPTLYSSRSCLLLARTLSENPCLLNLIKGVELCPTSNSNGNFFTAEEMRSIRYLLGLESLVTLTIGGDLAVGAERFLNSLSYPESIVKLHVNGSARKDSLSCPASLEWDEVLASRFPSLQTLELSNLDLDIVYPSFPYRLQLSKLALSNVQLVGGDLSYILQDTKSLKQLCVSGELSSEMDEQVSFICQSFGVEDLRYDLECVQSWRPTLFDEGLFLPSTLRVLQLNGVRVDMETLNAVQRCYPDIEELRVTGRSVSLRVEDWVEFVSSGGCAKLRFLEVPEGTNLPPFKRWAGPVEESLKVACSDRNIVLYTSRIGIGI